MSDRYYSVDALKLLRELGAKAGICVVATHNIGTTSDGVDAVINGLNANTATAPTVVLLEPEDSRRLLVGFNANSALRRNIALIGTSRWGRDMSIVRGYEDIAEGLITLRFEMN